MTVRPVRAALAACAALAAWAAAAGAMGPARAEAQTVASEAYHPFQQGVEYRIEASQDDETAVLTGRAVLRYTNRAPEALERLYFHQYLNAFRPNSAWSDYDLRFGERTFQDLGPDEHAYERVHAFAIDGDPVTPVYPGAPDSTVLYVELSRPLDPGASLVATIDWTARLATEPRRQGRRGRHFNWAHWYPRIAFYGADGWEYRAHIRPGELNGTFGSYDVVIELPEDQVVGATGVPVEGDPGWHEAAIPRSPLPLYRRASYGDTERERLGLLGPEPPPGRKRLRWRAEDVHHFAWSASPEYRYLSGAWQDRAIHLLWEGDDAGWDPHRILEQQIQALDWVEELVGEYPWPQITVTGRIEPGATEFPMLYMTSGGAVVHETMHMIFHGVLANNEWREGWLDEGMATFLSTWLTRERGAAPGAWQRLEVEIARLDSLGLSEPVGLPGAEFSSYDMYSTMTYAKGALVLRMLRDAIGEAAFRAALREYYGRFRFRQVTGHDFRNVMEEVSGQDLGPFFQRWIHSTDGRIGAEAEEGRG